MRSGRHSTAIKTALVVLGAVSMLLGRPSAFALDPALEITQYAHTAWKVEDGFFKGAIRAIVQMPNGYLWLGTEFGLVRFDGVRSVPWSPPPAQHLPSSNIRSLLATRDGTLWIGTVEGLASWKDGKLNQYSELAGQNILTLFEDREGTVWAGTFGVPNAKLCAIQHGAVKCYGGDGTFGQWVFSLYEDRKGRLWVGTMTGLWKWKPGPPEHHPLPHSIETSQALVETDDAAGLIIVGSGIRQMVDENIGDYPLPTLRGRFTPLNVFRDRHRGLWIGTLDRGLLHLSQGKLSPYAQNDGLSGDHIWCIFEDREGSIWVGTGDGLDRFREFAVSSISVKQGLSSASVMSVLAARDGSLWLSTLDGLNRWKNGQVTIYRARSEAPTESTPLRGGVEQAVTEITDAGLPDSEVGSLFEDARGRIWVSSRQEVAWFEGGRFTPVKEVPRGWVNAIAGNADGSVWLSYQDHGLVRWADGKVVERIPWSELGGDITASSMVADPIRGGLWLGFFQGGVVHLKDGRVSALYRKGEGIGGGRVMGLQLDRDGTLWAGTEGGLSRVKDGRVATLTTGNGLPCEKVHWAVEDEHYNFWLYTACGLLRVSRSDLESWASDPRRTIQFTALDSSDGVRSYALLWGYNPRVSKSADGRLWFAHFESLSVIDPLHLAENKLPPPVHIEQITADGKKYDASQGLRLPPLVRNLAIDYTALSLVAPEKIRFRFKLEGQDKDWREVVNQRRVEYSNLAPGNYRFLVTACNNSGVWNERGASLDLAIAPAYYQTNWFRALCAVGAAALLGGLYRLRVLQLQNQERKLREAIETIPTLAWITRPDGSNEFANRRWVEYTGLSAKDTAGSGWQVAVHPEDLDRHLAKWRASVASGEPFEDEARLRRAADGQYRWFLVRAVPLRDRRGNILRWYGAMTDIEDRKRAEDEREKLRQLETELAHINRVSMMGELAASLSHELKQPITAAITNASTSLLWLNADEPDVQQAREATQRIIKDGARAGAIIDRLRSLYKKGAPHQRESVDLNELVREMLVLMRSEANRHSIAMRTDLQPELPKVNADRVQLQQVLMNLMLNAVEAMKDSGGELTVSSRLDPDGQLLTSVIDTGVGLPADNADQIFTAFFSTKPQGSGMGLTISRSIVESHGGRLWATANAGPGATFHFSLPTAAAEAKAPATGT